MQLYILFLFWSGYINEPWLAVRTDKNTTDWFHSGNIYPELIRLMRNTTDGAQINGIDRWMFALGYADDTSLLTNSVEELHDSMNRVVREAYVSLYPNAETNEGDGHWKSADKCRFWM